MRTFARYLTQSHPKWRLPILAIIVGIGIVICSSSALAQSGAGSIQGTVTDSTGAVIPDAAVHVANIATAVSADTRANAVGFYQVPNLFTGTYIVTATARGMKTTSITIELLVAQAATINLTLTPGAVTERVVVTADAVQLTTTDNGTVTTTLENARINQLPMNGRVLMSQVQMITPGLESSAYGGTGSRINGLEGEALEYVADGVTLTNRQFGGMNQSQSQAPDPDAVQEVRVETTNASAEYATPATAIITTKSGTNSLHGSFFETARNNAVGIARNRNNPVNFQAPHLVRNEFGASIGGPIILPKVYHGKDKSFWFFAYERYSLTQAISELVTVPTTAMRQGDFSGLKDSNNNLYTLYDPNTTYNASNCAASPTNPVNPYCRTPFPGNVIPSNRISPTAKIMYDITPLPSSSDDPLVTSNLIAVNPSRTIIPTISFRLDHVFNEKNRAYIRYTDDLQTNYSLRNYPNNSPATIAADGFPAQATGMGYNPNGIYAVALGYTHLFSPNFFSETILSNEWFHQHNFAGGAPLTDFEAELGLPNNFGEAGFPTFGGTGSILICPYGGTQFIYGLSQIISNLDENLTKTFGHHQMQFGGRYRHERFGYLPDETADVVAFTTQDTGLYNPASGTTYGGTAFAGNQNGDMFLGGAGSYTVNLEPAYSHTHDMEFDGYFQDNYRVAKNLTVNLGLRWESHPATWVKYGVMEGFDLKNDAMVLASTPAQLISEGYTTQAIMTNLQNIGVKIETPSQAGLSGKMVDDYNFNFAPRVGIAYQPFGGKYGTVLRGAYGQFIYPINVRTTYKNLMSNPPFHAGYQMSYTAANYSPDGLQNYLLRNRQSVVMGTNSSGVVNSTSTTALTPGSGGIYSFDPRQAPNLVTQTNFTIEQPLKGNTALRVSYLYVHGSHLDQIFGYNNHPSEYVWEMETGTRSPQGTTIGLPTYAATATGPYDNTTWGGNTLLQKSGWSNQNALQATYERLFHRGVAYQISYNWSNSFRVGGNSNRDSNLYPAQNYANSGIGTMTPAYGTMVAPTLPPARPAGIASYATWHALDRYENYQFDSAIPKQHITFNGIVDLPFGRGKRFLGNSNHFLDEVVGGFQLAGDGTIFSQAFQVANGNWGPTNPLKVYKHSAPITDCRSGVCHPAYEWFNGYLAPTVLPANSSNAGCTLTSALVTGLPSGWAPYSSPIDTDCNKADAAYKDYGQNDVNVKLSDGSTNSDLGYSPGPNNQGTNPFGHTFLNGPINYTVDLSVFKVFPITERMNLRVNVDAFNALNVQGYNNPNTTDGVEQVQPGVGVASSFNTPRQLQFTMRLTF